MFFETFVQSTKYCIDKVAVIEAESKAKFKYKDLIERANTLSISLRTAGVRKGQVLPIWVPNCYFSIALELAAAKIGAIGLFLNTRYGTLELSSILKKVNSRILIIDPDFEAGIFESHLGLIRQDSESSFSTNILTVNGEQFGNLRDDVGNYDHLAHRDFGNETVESLSPLNLFATSGTTSDPKLVIHTRRAITLRSQSLPKILGWGPGRSYLSVLPLCGVFGFNSTLAVLFAGGPLVTLKQFEAETSLDAVQTYGVTDLIGTDHMFFRLIECPNYSERMKTVKHILSSNFTGRIKALIEFYEQKLGIKVSQPYGSSETQALLALWLENEESSTRALTGGHLTSDHIEARVADPSTGKPLSIGQTGELEFKGAELFDGYWNDPVSTSHAFSSDGWYKSGEMGCVREDGSILFLSRMSDSLRVGGFLLDPREIEYTLMAQFKNICQAVVIGVDDKNGQGQAIFAFVQLSDNNEFDSSKIVKTLKGKIASYKIPKYIVPIESFPLTDTGANGEKIKRAK